MKISELPTQNFFGDYQAQYSYILVNYSDGTTTETKKMTIEELGHAIGVSEKFLKYNPSNGNMLPLAADTFEEEYIEDTSYADFPWLSNKYVDESDDSEYYRLYASKDNNCIRLCLMDGQTPTVFSIPLLGYERNGNNIILTNIADGDQLITLTP